MVWYGMVYVVWCGVVWCGMAWYGIVRYSTVRYGIVWYGTVWYGMALDGMVWYDTVWYSTVWYSTVRKEAHLVYSGAWNRLREPWRGKNRGRAEQGTSSVGIASDRDRLASTRRRATPINSRLGRSNRDSVQGAISLHAPQA